MPRTGKEPPPFRGAVQWAGGGSCLGKAIQTALCRRAMPDESAELLSGLTASQIRELRVAARIVRLCSSLQHAGPVAALLYNRSELVSLSVPDTS